MSRSRNTEKESVWAALQIGRAEDGAPYQPRIIARQPRRGDVHPLPNILPLADGGDDTVENAVALCPNCHRKKHFG